MHRARGSSWQMRTTSHPPSRRSERRVIASARSCYQRTFTGRRSSKWPLDPLGYAAMLYATLHSLDDAECDVVVIEDVPATPAWRGVQDRIERASR